MANVERLQQLRRVVEAAPDERFRMDYWTTISNPCGTAHCAAGWAAVDPWFQENTDILGIFDVEDDIAEPNYGDTCYRLSTLFEIDVDDSFSLFLNNYNGELENVTKEHVLANIDRLIAGEHATIYTKPGGDKSED